MKQRQIFAQPGRLHRMGVHDRLEGWALNHVGIRSWSNHALLHTGAPYPGHIISIS